MQIRKCGIRKKSKNANPQINPISLSNSERESECECGPEIRRIAIPTYNIDSRVGVTAMGWVKIDKEGRQQSNLSSSLIHMALATIGRYLVFMYRSTVEQRLVKTHLVLEL